MANNPPKVEVSYVNLLYVLKRSLEMGKIDNAIAILDDVIKQLEGK